MLINYDPVLIEDVVFWVIKHREEKGDCTLFDEYHRLADAIYELPVEKREATFEKLHIRFFQKLGYGEIIKRAFEEFPGLQDKVSQAIITRASHKTEEDVDLRGTDVVQIKLRTERFFNLLEVQAYLCHELMHISDMLDESFCYERPSSLGASSQIEETIIKDRYKVIWNIFTDSRLSKKGLPTILSREERLREFDALYQKFPVSQRIAIFENFWQGDKLTHPEILEAALNPATLIARWGDVNEQGGLEREQIHLPGLPCPLCSFPSYHWVTKVSDEVAQLIQEDFPEWRPENGICERCFELYQMRMQEDILR